MIGTIILAGVIATVSMLAYHYRKKPVLELVEEVVEEAVEEVEVVIETTIEKTEDLVEGLVADNGPVEPVKVAAPKRTRKKPVVANDETPSDAPVKTTRKRKPKMKVVE